MGELLLKVCAIFDTNVFVASGFNLRSASARLIDEVRAGHIILVWSEATRGETRSVLTRIPRLRWVDVAPLFTSEGKQRCGLNETAATFVVDPEDRKFAALAMLSGAPLVSADQHLLIHRDRLNVVPPGEFLRSFSALRGSSSD